MNHRLYHTMYGLCKTRSLDQSKVKVLGIESPLSPGSELNVQLELVIIELKFAIHSALEAFDVMCEYVLGSYSHGTNVVA